MTNIFKTPEKRERKKRLLEIGIQTLQREGWTVTRERGSGGSSVRRIAKGSDRKLVSIRTTQSQWIAFPPKTNGKGWTTLDDVDVVLAVSVDANVPPREALVHWLPADDMRQRFDLARKARVEARRVMPKRRGVWIPLYEREDASESVSYVGGGAGLDYPPIARVSMTDGVSAVQATGPEGHAEEADADGGQLTIPEAKRRLARWLGVQESSIKITVEA
jgi:hypothetical protein